MALLIVDSKACIGCGACVDVCLFDALDLVDGVVVVNDNCTACGVCLAECPVDALALPKSTQAGTADLESYEGVWVWVEQFQGEPSSISWEMLGKGRALADALETTLTACVLGHGMDDVTRRAIAHTLATLHRDASAKAAAQPGELRAINGTKSRVTHRAVRRPR